MTGTSQHAPHHLSSVQPPRPADGADSAPHHPGRPRNPPYYEDRSPGSGVLPPRAWYPRSDAARLSLHGRWRFRLSASATAVDESFARPDFDDAQWEELRVPGHWALQGRFASEGSYEGNGTARPSGAPAYTNTAYPFPVDPPRVPDENPTGDHRQVFDLPEGWGEGPAVLHFAGVESCARVWLNGQELGHFKGSRLPHEFEVGALLRPRGNVLAVRVHQWSSGSYLEDQDQWWLPGIFREVAGPPPSRRCGRRPLRPRRVRSCHRPRHPAGGVRTGRPGDRPGARPRSGDRRERHRSGAPLDGRAAASLRRGAGDLR